MYMIFLCPQKGKRARCAVCAICLILCGISGCLFDAVPVSAAPPKPTAFHSESLALMDGYSGRILLGKEEDAARANASTTKILTCILALEQTDTQALATVSKRAAGQPKVRLGIKENESYRVLDLLYCLMLESYNDCAVVIAEHVAGSVEAFAQMMNEKASMIGCKDTYFLTPNGLDASDAYGFHHTTAADICRIMRYCVWQSGMSSQFLEITQTNTYQFKDPLDRWHTLRNHNQLLGTMEGAISGKTGFTADAGYCYVMAYDLGGKRFCAAFLGCGWPNNKNYKWQDAGRLIAYAKDTYELHEIHPDETPISFAVGDCFAGEADLQAWGKKTVLRARVKELPEAFFFMLSPDDAIGEDKELAEQISLPLQKGDSLGVYRLRLNDETIGEWVYESSSHVQRWDFVTLLTLIIREFAFGA